MAEKRPRTSRSSSKSSSAARTAKRAPGVRGASKSKSARSTGAKPARKPAVKKKVAARAAARPVKTSTKAKTGVVAVVEGALDEMKAVHVKVLDVRKLTDIADTLIIASGNSDRHVRSISDRVVERAKKAGFRPMGVEGQRDGEWVLVDLQDVIVHVMLPRVREMYRLENLWDVSAARRDAAVGE
ncbi:MAG TPA: ribosome silencing factor [Povalibacter sp.]|nr:ribosome silencing factor [Povalibacter sp.]